MAENAAITRPHAPRPVGRRCSCGRPAVQYQTAEGLRAAPYCSECATGSMTG